MSGADKNLATAHDAVVAGKVVKSSDPTVRTICLPVDEVVALLNAAVAADHLAWEAAEQLGLTVIVRDALTGEPRPYDHEYQLQTFDLVERLQEGLK